MNITFITCFSIFALYAIFHLIICLTLNERNRKLTKPYCLLPLIVCAAITAIKTKNYYLFIVLAGLVFHMSGDIALIFKKKSVKFYIIGMILFAFGHMCYGTYIVETFHATGRYYPAFLNVIAFALLAIFALALYPLTSKFVGRLALLGDVYVPLILLMFTLGIYTGFSFSWSSGAILFVCGYAVFAFSDLFLIYTNFFKRKKYYEFVVMGSYLLAELFIVYGLLIL